MSAQQIVRAAIVKNMNGFSYDELAFHRIGSRCYRHFSRIGFAHEGFSMSTLHATIKALRPETWEAVHRLIVAYREDKEIEAGREARIDCTVLESNIHQPSDSSLLWDAVRCMTRPFDQLNEQSYRLEISLKDHTRRAKRRMFGIQNAKNNKVRKRLYRNLLRVTKNMLGYARRELSSVERILCLYSVKVMETLKELMELTEKVISQTIRRVTQGGKVPAEEKMVSLFQPHTDFFVKGCLDTYYGHKIFLTVGRSNLVTACLITNGKPADARWSKPCWSVMKRSSGYSP